MFRNLIPLLAEHYRVVAPDHLGFGLSDAPSIDEFDYSFESLAGFTKELLDQLKVDRFAMYVHDYGAPIGWRLALEQPDRIWAIVSQNGNAYEQGFEQDFWKPVWAYARDENEETEAAVRGAFDLENIRWQYLHGEPDVTLLAPETWLQDHQRVNRPGNDLVQLQLTKDYISNVQLYPSVQRFFRETQVPMLAAWGRGDGIFVPEGARAFTVDLPSARIELIDGGHFVLESSVEIVAQLMNEFLSAADRRK
jgi:pimeloyl-ACP methyl ester carboxylesterase